MAPTIGRIVLYKASESAIRPAIITDVHNDTCVNLQVFQPGHDNWRTSVSQGDGVGQWEWPVREPVLIAGPVVEGSPVEEPTV